MKKLQYLFALLVLCSCPLLGQNQVRCVVEVSTATTLTRIGGECLAVENVSLYITDILFSSSVAATDSADAMPTLSYGTGTNCGTGTTRFWLSMNVADAPIIQSFKTPIRIPRNNDICWIASVAGSKTIVITGYLAP